jgi:L-malate glycosyltransferase
MTPTQSDLETKAHPSVADHTNAFVDTSVQPIVSRSAILKIMQCSNLGGMEQVAYSLLQGMHNEGTFEFRVASPRPFGDGESYLRNVDGTPRSFDYRGKFGWRSFRQFRNHIRALAEETDHIWITGTCACSLAAVMGLPHQKVLGHHFHHFDDRTSMLKWFGFYHGLCRQLDVITYPTDFTRNEALTIAPWLQDRTHVVHYGYPISYDGEKTRLERQFEMRRQLGLPDGAFIVGNAGWLIKRKRFDVFLETAARIKQKIPHAYFVICGGGPLEEQLKKQAHQLGIADSVRFTGWVKDTVSHYQAWDVCLFNSDFDALGRTPMEAASHGCLAVASVRYGGLSEFLKTGETGALLDKHDPGQLAAEIIDLHRNPGKALSLREAAVAKLRADYSVEKSLEFYRSIFG